MRTRWNLQRADTPELLDLGQGSQRDVVENLTEMQRINDVLGGTRALVRYLYPRLREPRLCEPRLCEPRLREPRLREPRLRPGNDAVRILDLGTGGAGLLRHLSHWAARRGLSLQVIGMDHSARVLSVAAQQMDHTPRIDLLHADALCPPLAPGSVDYVISSLFLHHLPPDGVIALLASAYRLARCGLVMSDLVRGRLPYLAFYAVAPLFARNRLTRWDGALSIRRAYTPTELSDLARRAGLRGAQVHAHFPWRMTLVVDK